MRDDQYIAEHSVTLLGGGPVDPEHLNRVLRIAPELVAADGGANHAHALKIPVTHIVGDFDSLTNEQLWRNSGANLTHLDEQETTDFEKCLYATEARLYLGLGFIGGRLDHTLACMATLAKLTDKTVILIGDEDIVFRCPSKLRIDMDARARVSLFPMSPVSAMTSKGLRWPLEGLSFAPDTKIGTSNEATGGPVEITVGAGALLVILPLSYLSGAIDALLG